MWHVEQCPSLGTIRVLALLDVQLLMIVQGVPSREADTMTRGRAVAFVDQAVAERHIPFLRLRIPALSWGSSPRRSFWPALGH